MTNINILSPHVADLIAAGEVVEKPASVIKELIENSFDAGAKNICVEFKNGGATYIRVTDDGKGMSPEDAGIAFLRHATSKLKDERGLEAISTMGFRGEALAAISAVSHVELITREKGAETGTRVLLTAGEIDDMTEYGCPEGTTMTIKNLFYNTPARLKFLKSDRAEASACTLTALRCALGHPEVSVRCIKDGTEEFFSPGDGKLDSCLYSLLGRDMATSMLKCNGSTDVVKIEGYISSPSACRGNRSAQYFFCNGRFIKSAMAQAALEQAYKNTLLVGKYPACVLNITLSPGSVDVNVHPAKTEVKFTDEKKVFDAIYYSALESLQGEKRTPEIEISASTKKAVETKSSENKNDFYKSMPSSQFKATVSQSKPAYTPPVHQTPAKNLWTPPVVQETKSLEKPASKETAEIPSTKTAQSTIPVEPIKTEPIIEPQQMIIETEEKITKPEQAIPDYKIIGEALDTYIIVQTEGQLVLIDKHACHERINFDKLKEQGRKVMVQNLLAPIAINTTSEESELLEKNGEILSELGFEIEPFGEKAFVIRAIPSDMFESDAKSAVEEIIEKLKKNHNIDTEEKIDEILHTVACKAAIKAGWKTDAKELNVLAEAVLSGRVKYCPHGRPVSMTVTRKDLDKLFKRIV